MSPAPVYALGRAQKPQDCFARLRRTRARFSSTARFSSITASLTRCASTSLARCASSRSRSCCSVGVRSGTTLNLDCNFAAAVRLHPVAIARGQKFLGGHTAFLKVFEGGAVGHLNSPKAWRAEARPVGLGIKAAHDLFKQLRGSGVEHRVAGSAIKAADLGADFTKGFVGFKLGHLVSPLLMHSCNANRHYRSSHKMHPRNIFSDTPDSEGEGE